MSLRSIIRNYTPLFLLELYRRQKKAQVRSELNKQAASGQILSKEDIKKDLIQLGIKEADSVLVHCSMSKIGYLENGPLTLIEALCELVGGQGHILMPTSPNPSLQLEHVRSNKVFDVLNSPSALGAVSETFRKMPGVQRSLSPTEPVSVLGPKASWLVSGHLGETTPYTSNSPFYRLTELNGKILYVGVTLVNAGTSLHLLEDAVADFKYPVYFSEKFNVVVRDDRGVEHDVQIKVHNPEFSAKRKCDGLLPMFEKEKVAFKGRLGRAETWVFDARGMFELMVKEYKENGVTMYTPNGEDLK